MPGPYYTDASGGKDTADAVLRRVGCGACRLQGIYANNGSIEPRITHIWRSNLPGAPQTVNRGELFAIISVLELIDPVQNVATIIYTDSAYCVRGFQVGRQAKKGSANDDLWTLFFLEVQRHQAEGGKVKLVKVPSHRDLQDAAEGNILLEDLIGNALADAIAGLAASEAQLPVKMVEAVSIGKGRVINILKHLVAANLANVKLLDGLPQQAGEEAPPQPPRNPVGRAKRGPTSAEARGHRIWRIHGRWRCSSCLLSRKSSRGAAWPKLCQQKASAPPWAGTWASGSRGVKRQLDTAAPPALPEVPNGPAQPEAPAAFDDPDAEDPFAMLGDDGYDSASELFPFEPAPAAPEQAVLEPLLAGGQRWQWGRLPATLALRQGMLPVGGALVHHTHMLICFGNNMFSFVLCCSCGGLTTGSKSSLLAEPCRRQCRATRQAQINRVLVKGEWPKPAWLLAYGPGEASPQFTFNPIAPDKGNVIERGRSTILQLQAIEPPPKAVASPKRRRRTLIRDLRERSPPSDESHDFCEQDAVHILASGHCAQIQQVVGPNIRVCDAWFTAEQLASAYVLPPGTEALLEGDDEGHSQAASSGQLRQPDSSAANDGGTALPRPAARRALN